MSQVLALVRQTPGRYAIVGMPCFVKASNLLRRSDPVLRDRIVLTVGIFCGHLKSARFADYLSVQLGVPPDQVAAINFRHKYEQSPASNYGVEITDRAGRKYASQMSEIYGGNWGYGFFKYDACHYCDDLAAETADVAFGDAWLPGYVNDPKGTNVVVVRNRMVDEVLLEGKRAARVHLEPIHVTIVSLSQASGLRDRREGLAF